MALIRKLFWVTLFLTSTFGFVVLFDFGPTNYFQSARLEFQNLRKLVGWQPEKKKDESDKVDK